MKSEFTLTIKVKYDNNGTAVKELRRLLEGSAEHLADRGLLTGESPAEVNEWSYKVTQDS